MEVMVGFAENIKRLRSRKQYSQPKLAAEAGLSKAYVYMLESGEMTNPSLDVLHRIADALDSTIAELIDEPRAASSSDAPEIPESLMAFAKRRKRAGEPLSEDDLVNLARTQFRGRRPETIEDWSYVYEFFRRTLGEE